MLGVSSSRTASGHAISAAGHAPSRVRLRRPLLRILDAVRLPCIPARGGPARLARLGPPLGAGVGLAVAGLEALDRDVSIDLRGGGRGVAEDLLDAAQVGTALQEVGRRAVAGGAPAPRPGRFP